MVFANNAIANPTGLGLYWDDLLYDDNTLCNVSDSGAHGKMFCGAGYNVFLLTDYVRDRKVLSIERAIYMLTWRTAEFFGLHDRGLLKEGMVADIAVFNLDEIEMRVDLQDVDRAAPGKGTDAGNVDRMVAPQHHRQGACVQNGAHAGLDIGMALFGIGVNDIGVADIDDGDIRTQIGAVILMVIGAAMAEGKERGRLADRPWPEPGAGAESERRASRPAKAAR